MWHAIDFRRMVALLAAFVAVLALPAGRAEAQSSSEECYYTYDDDPDFPDSEGSYVYAYADECDALGPAANVIGVLLSNAGDALVSQQINFGGFANFVTPTGKLRHTEHDGLEIVGTGATTSSFEIDEGSVFANGSYDLPGTYFGGKVRVSALAGYNGLSQDADDGTFETDIDAFIYGGSYLWSKGSFYSMSLIIGVSGEADGSAGGSQFDYDVSGYFTNSIYGYTFDMSGGWKFDARVNIGHYDVDTGRFETAGGFVIKGVSEAWHAGITGTVFTIVEVSGGVMRPYLLLAYKNVFDEDIDIRGDLTASFDQADDYGKVEVGFDYVAGILTYGAAAYGEFSEDEETIGARLGVSVKLQ